MNSREPHLLRILRLAVVCLAEAVVLKSLRIGPGMEPKHPSPLVQRDRLAENPHTGVTAGVWQLLKTEGVKPIRPRHDDACDGVPDTEECYGRPLNRNYACELRSTIILRLRPRHIFTFY